VSIRRTEGHNPALDDTTIRPAFGGIIGPIYLLRIPE